MVSPSFEEFSRLAQQGGCVIPVTRELLADMETPVSVFRKMVKPDSHAFLLESVEGGESLGRYSFLGVDPAVLLRVRGAEQEIICDDPSLKPAANPIATLRMLLGRYNPVEIPGLPQFYGGAVGYMSYDTVRYYERIPNNLPDKFHLPDCLVMIAETLVVFDHVKHRMILVANARVEPGADPRVAYEDALHVLDNLRKRLRTPLPVMDSGTAVRRLTTMPATSNGAGEHPVHGVFDSLSLAVTSDRTRASYEDAVRAAKEYITAGDIFQVVLSQRFSTQVTCDPFDVYRSLRAVNPSPYMFYLQCGTEFQLAGSSPEILSRLTDGKVTVRPIAGTRPRGADHDEDIAHERDLLADAKERAEHVMLVDLGRNDVGRVSEYGTVTVTDFMAIERYSHVMHIVSNVEGRIAPGRDALDVLAATFPAGILIGAPKIRAMEIIDELESSRRGPYGGSVIYMGFNGAMDSCITIRTAVIIGQTVHVQAGAGVVADSIPAAEYMETVNKAMGMLKAVELAEKGLE